MQTLAALSPERRQRMAVETLEIYDPAGQSPRHLHSEPVQDLALKELTAPATTPSIKPWRHGAPNTMPTWRCHHRAGWAFA